MSTTAPGLVGAYDHRVVVLSIIIAIAASFAALDLAGRVSANPGRDRPVWLLGAAFAQGVGIWSMHYTGVLTFKLPVPVWYDWPTALAAFTIAFAQAFLAFMVVSRPRMPPVRTAIAALLMGTAIAGLHYTAMASMQLAGECHYSTPLVALSVAFAIAFSWLWLRLTFTFRLGVAALQRVGGALAMGAALCVMHYTAMSAARFTASSNVPDLSHAVRISFLGVVAIAATALTVLSIAVSICAVNRIKQHREALRATTEQLRALAKNASLTREQEAARIGRELHDELGSALTGLKWDVESIANALAQPVDEHTAARLREQLGATLKVIDSIIGAVRRIASELRPRILDDLGVVEAIEWQAQQFEARTGIACHCNCSVEGVELSKETSTAIFRIFQEALTNVLRHSGATEVNVSISVEANVFILRVRDNGRGITDDEKSADDAMGLLGMRERAALIGATVDIIGSLGEGTEVTVRLPLGRQGPTKDVTTQRRNGETSASGR